MVPGWDVCAPELPAAVFLSLSSSSWRCENRETAGYLSDVDTWGLIWASANPEWFHGIQ